ncbi:MAG: primosomal protein N' [Rhodobacteraceae bacterium]|nr:primosomal protein N' [Paracoccaceae bacterium]
MTQPEDFNEGEAVAVLTTEPVERLLDYLAPTGGVSIGRLVKVPLGPRQVIGVVWGKGTGFAPEKLRKISTVSDAPAITGEMLDFIKRVADYNVAPLSAVLRLATRAPGLLDPPAKRKLVSLSGLIPAKQTAARKKVIAFLQAGGGRPFAPVELAQFAGVSQGVVTGLIKQGVLLVEDAPRDLPYPRLDPAHKGKALSALQSKAAKALRKSVQSRTYHTTLLKGVTGSGKTEVYLEAVAEVLTQGRQGLVLLPEIALTVDFIARLEARFGARPAEWHSGATMSERRRCWRAVAMGEAQLVVGARSALFLPFFDLGLIVVDEEHDGSYKQEEGVYYHARDMAVLRASISGAGVILATATPSLETWANAEAGKYIRLDLPERFGTAKLPEMAAIDMRSEKMQPNQWISPTLREEMRKVYGEGSQSLLFLNRRGYAPLTLCRACGEQVGCESCDARMVEHKFQNRLVCHQCGATKPIPDTCPSCEVSGKMTALGPGVERIAEEVAEVFPDARVEILSSDLSDSARGLKERIEAIAAGKADIIIGTQMVAKGHNFPHLTLVGVIDADLGLQGGDLRAAEKSFQLIRQVAGRAGRAEKPGRALLQSFQPGHPVIEAILSGDEEAFWQTEAKARLEAGMPPYGRLAGVIISSPKQADAFDIANRLARNARPLLNIGARVFGPAAAPIAKVRDHYRVRLLVKAAKGAPLQRALRLWVRPLKRPPNLRIRLDIDPQTFF